MDFFDCYLCGWGGGGGCCYGGIPYSGGRGRSSYCLYMMAGGIQFLLGLALLILGVFILVFTIDKYQPGGIYIYTTISSAIWGGALILLAGVMGFTLARNAARGCASCYGILVFLIALIIAPAIVILESLQLFYYKYIEDFYSSDGFSGDNAVLFSVSLAIVILGFLEFLVAFFLLIGFCCCSGDLYSSPSVTYVDQPAAAPSYDIAYSNYRPYRTRGRAYKSYAQPAPVVVQPSYTIERPYRPYGTCGGMMAGSTLQTYGGGGGGMYPMYSSYY